MQHYDVIVAGCGPVGALLTVLLGSAGVRVLNVDRDTAPYSAPRAVAADDATLRQIGAQCTGIARWLHESSLHCPIDLRTGPPTDPKSWSVIGPEPPVLVPATGFMDTLFLHQPDFERQLRARIAQLPTAKLQLGTAITGYRVRNPATDALNAARIAVTLETVAEAISTAKAAAASAPEPSASPERSSTVSGTASTVTARYLVGADGGASTVRRLMGAGFEGSSFPDEPWVVVDVETEDPAVLAGWRCFNFICDTARPFVHVPLPGNSCGRRFEFMLLAGEKPDAMATREAACALLRTHARVDPAALRLRRIAVYTFHARMATSWRAGPVLLAGDAAHCMPPFRGQGMCAGLRDAAALSWRLAHVIHGHAAEEALLPSYEVERRAHVQSVVAVAALMGRLITIRNRPIALLRNLAFGCAYRCPLTHGHIKTPFAPPAAIKAGLIHAAARGGGGGAGGGAAALVGFAGLGSASPRALAAVPAPPAAAPGTATAGAAAMPATASSASSGAGQLLLSAPSCGGAGEPLPNAPVVYVTAAGRHIRGRLDEFLTPDGPALLRLAAAVSAAAAVGVPEAADVSAGGAEPAAAAIAKLGRARSTRVSGSARSEPHAAPAPPVASCHAPPWVVLLAPHTIRGSADDLFRMRDLRERARQAFGDAVVVVQMLPGCGGASRARLHASIVLQKLGAGGSSAKPIHPHAQRIAAGLNEHRGSFTDIVNRLDVVAKPEPLRPATALSELDDREEIWCAGSDVALVDIDGSIGEWLRTAANGADMIAVRPDRVVYGTYKMEISGSRAARRLPRACDYPLVWITCAILLALLVQQLCARWAQQWYYRLQLAFRLA